MTCWREKMTSLCAFLIYVQIRWLVMSSRIKRMKKLNLSHIMVRQWKGENRKWSMCFSLVQNMNLRRSRCFKCIFKATMFLYPLLVFLLIFLLSILTHFFLIILTEGILFLAASLSLSLVLSLALSLQSVARSACLRHRRCLSVQFPKHAHPY